MSRSTETIRLTLKAHDRDHPDRAIFPNTLPPLDDEAKAQIYRRFRLGVSAEVLAKQYGRTRSSVYRVINEIRARRILGTKLELIDHPSFALPEMAAQILGPMPEPAEGKAMRRPKAPKGLPPYLASLYEVPLLDRDQEMHLFRKMNYLKYQSNLIRSNVDPTRAKTADLDQIDRLQEEALAVKNQIIRANLRLVVSIAKRHVGPSNNFFELVSDGNMSLIRAVEKFDFSRGNKFSTYASWAIMKNFARSIPEEKHRRERYVTGTDELFASAPDSRTDEQECLATAEQASHRVNRLLEYLEPCEREIIRLRAGLDDGNNKGLTLEEIGQRLGITKERVRQLNVRIMNKLRTIAKDQKMEA